MVNNLFDMFRLYDEMFESNIISNFIEKIGTSSDDSNNMPMVKIRKYPEKFFDKMSDVLGTTNQSEHLVVMDRSFTTKLTKPRRNIDDVLSSPKYEVSFMNILNYLMDDRLDVGDIYTISQCNSSDPINVDLSHNVERESCHENPPPKVNSWDPNRSLYSARGERVPNGVLDVEDDMGEINPVANFRDMSIELGLLNMSDISSLNVDNKYLRSNVKDKNVSHVSHTSGYDTRDPSVSRSIYNIFSMNIVGSEYAIKDRTYTHYSRYGVYEKAESKSYISMIQDIKNGDLTLTEEELLELIDIWRLERCRLLFLSLIHI